MPDVEDDRGAADVGAGVGLLPGVRAEAAAPPVGEAAGDPVPGPGPAAMPGPGAFAAGPADQAIHHSSGAPGVTQVHRNIIEFQLLVCVSGPPAWQFDRPEPDRGMNYEVVGVARVCGSKSAAFLTTLGICN